MHNIDHEECDEFRHKIYDKFSVMFENQYEIEEFIRDLDTINFIKSDGSEDRITKKQRLEVMPFEIKFVYNIKIAFKKAYRYSRDLSELVWRILIMDLPGYEY